MTTPTEGVPFRVGRGPAVRGGRLPEGEGLDQAPGDAGREQGVAAVDGGHRGEQPFRPGVLEQEPGGSGAQRAVDVLVEVEGGQHEHPGRASAGLGQDALGGLDAVHAGHPDVHQDHVGQGFGGEPHRFLAVTGLAHDLEAGRRLKQADESGADEELVVDDEHSGHLVRSSPRRASDAEVGRVRWTW